MRKKEKTNISIKNEVLSIVDQLYDRKALLGPQGNKGNISLRIVESISGVYAQLNCGNYFAFEDIVIPYLIKLDENQRLSVVKDLLTVGYIDIATDRIFMRGLPYLNTTENEPYYPYVTDIPINS